ncbi:mitochondrial carrier domain-containing protein [Lanmaoa asiatica]|nr:mitochondrial carrier domain-containing protein [Lanmaoa asiatica]
MTSQHPPSFFPTAALDHAAAGLGAGVVAVLCMHPLDLLKVKLQVSTSKPQGGIGKQICYALRGIHAEQGWRGLYRGVGPNIAGNASSWGLYFLLSVHDTPECVSSLILHLSSYNMLKKRASGDNPNFRLSPGDYLLCSAQASAVTAIMTNPIWVVKVRMFTTRADDPKSYRGLWHGLSSIYNTEGIRGLWKGTSLALVGVSNGAIQFMAYEEMKRWGFEQKRKRFARVGKTITPEDDKLSNSAYTVMSGGSKLFALTVTYPYQVIRSRLQNNATTHLYPDIPTTIKRTWRGEGIQGFYRGLGTNFVRVLPGTCVTFVVYENLAWLFRTTALRREDKQPPPQEWEFGTRSLSSLKPMEHLFTSTRLHLWLLARSAHQIPHIPPIRSISTPATRPRPPPFSSPPPARRHFEYVLPEPTTKDKDKTKPDRTRSKNDRRPTNRQIPFDHVFVVDPETNKLSPTKQRLKDLLENRQKRVIELVASTPEPIVRVTTRSEVEARYREMKRAARRGAKVGEEPKEVQLTWGVARGDLEHKLRKARRDLEKGYRVVVVVTMKNRHRPSNRQQLVAFADEISGALCEIGKEWKEREFTERLMVLSFRIAESDDDIS